MTEIRFTRMYAIFEAMKQGFRKPEDLVRAADNAQREVTDRIGRASAVNFFRIANAGGISEVGHARRSTSEEDLRWHTDAWVIFKEPVFGRTMLPLQIKSSETGVRVFKESPAFSKYPFILVVNSNQKRKDKEIVRDFRMELERVTRLLAPSGEQR